MIWLKIANNLKKFIMKALFYFFSFVFFLSCNIRSQEYLDTIIVDKNLENKFSEGPLPGVRGGAYKTYLDGVLVDSSAEDGIQYLYNASIRDIRGNYFFPFDTCRSYYSEDTLFIHFSKMNIKEADSIRVKITGKKIIVDFILYDKNTSIRATNPTLTVNKKINQKGQVFLGNISFQVNDNIKNKEYLFKGAFISTLE